MYLTLTEGNHLQDHFVENIVPQSMFSLAVVNPDFELLFFSPLFSGRADPCTVCEDNTSTPMEIASDQTIDRKEVLAILGEFAELPVSGTLEMLSKLMYRDGEEKTKKDFRKLLSLLPVEAVGENI